MSFNFNNFQPNGNMTQSPQFWAQVSNNLNTPSTHPVHVPPPMIYPTPPSTMQNSPQHNIVRRQPQPVPYAHVGHAMPPPNQFPHHYPQQPFLHQQSPFLQGSMQQQVFPQHQSLLQHQPLQQQRMWQQQAQVQQQPLLQQGAMQLRQSSLQVHTPVPQNQNAGQRQVQASQQFVDPRQLTLQRAEMSPLGQNVFNEEEAQMRTANSSQQEAMLARLTENRLQEQQIAEQEQRAKAEQARQNEAKAKADAEEAARIEAELQAEAAQEAERFRKLEAKRLKQQNITSLKEKFRGDRSVLYRHYNAYLQCYPLREGQRRNPYLHRLLANQRMPTDKDSELARAIRYAKDHWRIYMEYPRDMKRALAWQEEDEKAQADI